MDSRLTDLLRTLREIERRVRELPGLSSDDRALAERVGKLLRDAGDVLADPSRQPLPVQSPPIVAGKPGGKCPWYITAAAVREFLALGSTEDTPGNFEAAEESLMCLVETHAKLAKDEGHRQIWRTGAVKFLARPHSTRLEFTVSMTKRSEGGLPQLVRVRDKGHHT